LNFVPNFFVATKPIHGLHCYVFPSFCVVFYYVCFSQIIGKPASTHGVFN
jgi:hypothetical protein